MENDDLPVSPGLMNIDTHGLDNSWQLLCIGSAADVYISSGSRVVRKIMRVSPGHFNDGDVEQGKEILLRYHKSFVDRSRAWSQLTSPYLAYSPGSSSTELTIDQEYCHLGDLRNYMKQDAHSRDICYRIIQDILNGLAYLHNHDPPVVHGNLNPGKMFVTAEGRVKIGEFGLAASTARFSHLVPSISFSGLVRWMSPERLQLEAAGSDESASTQSDIWSLGCTIAEIVTGELPYAKYKHDARITNRIMKGELPTAIEQIIPRHQETEGTSDDEIKIKSPCTTFLQDIVRQCWDGAQYRAIAKNLLDQINMHKSRSHGSGSPPSQSPLATNAPSVLSVGREHVHSELTFKANQPSAELEARPSTSALAEGADAGSLHSGRRPNLPVSSGARDVGDPASTTDKNLVRESTTWAQLSEEEVLSALNDYVTSAVTRAGPLINPHGADDGATADSISGVSLCLYYAALDTPTSIPSMHLPPSGGIKRQLYDHNCPPRLLALFSRWARTFSYIRNLPAEYQVRLEWVLCNRAHYSTIPSVSNIAINLRELASDISRRQSGLCPGFVTGWTREQARS